MQFSKIPGFDALKAVLIKAAQSGHIAHAQLFSGNPGSAALPIALAYATYINCTDRSEQDSCGVCPSCVKYGKMAHPDLNFVFPVATSKDVPSDPSSAAYIKQFRQFIAENPFGGPHDWGSFFGAENKQLNIPVSEARFIVSALALKPYEAAWKVMFIWLPEYMNQQAANALLKVLEEPTPSTLFFLVTEQEDAIIGTILSRVQKVRVPSFENDQIESFLLAEGVTPQQAKTVARLADGSISEAKRLLEEDTGAYYSLFTTWMRACYAYKYNDMLDVAEAFGKLGREGQKSFFQYALGMLRDTFLAHEQVTDLVKLQEEELGFVSRFAPFVHVGNMEQILKELNDAWAAIERNASAKIVFFDTSLNLATYLRQLAPDYERA